MHASDADPSIIYSRCVSFARVMGYDFPVSLPLASSGVTLAAHLVRSFVSAEFVAIPVTSPSGPGGDITMIFCTLNCTGNGYFLRPFSSDHHTFFIENHLSRQTRSKKYPRFPTHHSVNPIRSFDPYAVASMSNPPLYPTSNPVIVNSEHPALSSSPSSPSSSSLSSSSSSEGSFISFFHSFSHLLDESSCDEGLDQPIEESQLPAIPLLENEGREVVRPVAPPYTVTPMNTSGNDGSFISFFHSVSHLLDNSSDDEFNIDPATPEANPSENSMEIDNLILPDPFFEGEFDNFIRDGEFTDCTPSLSLSLSLPHSIMFAPPQTPRVAMNPRSPHL